MVFTGAQYDKAERFEKAERKGIPLCLVRAGPLQKVTVASSAGCALQGYENLGMDPEKSNRDYSKKRLLVAIGKSEKELSRTQEHIGHLPFW